MNREIKFRGVCAISKEIVYGDLIHGVGSKSNNIYILPNRINLAGVKHCDPLDGVKVLLESVGQYTGLKDKDGKEIYEGDICKKERHRINYEIVFFKNAWAIKSETDNAIWHQEFCNGANSNKLTVIGNIHQNPELLQ
jgi:uncharacterized phage protein (TIGR01671 family)